MTDNAKEQEWWQERQRSFQRWLKWLKVLGTMLVLFACSQMWLSHKASDLQSRAQAIGGSIDVGTFPLSGAELFETEQKLEESEEIYTRLAQLKPQAERFGAVFELGDFPYDSKRFALFEEQILASEALQERVDDFIKRAKVMGWNLEIAFPFSEEQLDLLEQQVLKTEELYGPVNHLERKYKAKMSFPYTQQAYERFDFEQYYLKPILISSGSFTMGSKQGDPDERPEHDVTLSHSFWMMEEELSQLTYLKTMKKNPSTFKECGEDCPVETISWLEAVQLSNQINTMLHLETCYQITDQEVVWTKGYDCDGWRLPTEAEWEYAAAGKEISLYAGGDMIDELSWYLANSDQKTHACGLKGANRSKLVDMSGNVSEWIWDRYGPYSVEKQSDPLGANTGEKRIVRGGSWASPAWGARVSFRDYNPPELALSEVGVRLCRTALVNE